MAFEQQRDPRYEPLQPTWEEADAWASRERKRREAWLAGPTEFEQDEWARRARRHSMFGPSESALGPSTEEVAEWAAREHKRRQAWLAGPTDEEKREWTRGQTRRVHGYPPSELTPTDEEIDGWATKEHARRQAWLAGPTEEEKRRWMRREAGSVWEDQADLSTVDRDVVDVAGRLLREADLATKGSIAALARAPFAIWSSLVRAGCTFEDERATRISTLRDPVRAAARHQAAFDSDTLLNHIELQQMRRAGRLNALGKVPGSVDAADRCATARLVASARIGYGTRVRSRKAGLPGTSSQNMS